MELMKEISERRAYRILSERPVPEDAVRRILEAGTLAPSCYNNQPWRLVAATGSALVALRAALSEGNAWATRAPLIVAVAVRESDDCRLDDGRDYALFDAGLCTMNMVIQATAEGLVAHPIAGYNPKKAKAALGIPKDHVLITLVVVAWRGSAEAGDDGLLAPWQKESESSARERKPFGERVSMDRWNLG